MHVFVSPSEKVANCSHVLAYRCRHAVRIQAAIIYRPQLEKRTVYLRDLIDMHACTSVGI